MVGGGGLAVLMLLEYARPTFPIRARRCRHDAANLALGLLNSGVVALLFASAIVAVTAWAESNRFDLLHLMDFSPWAKWAVAIVGFDLWMGTWHLLNHKVPVLWRFHAVHHADRELDASSALRFYTGEIVLSSIGRLSVLPLLGMTAPQVLVYETVRAAPTVAAGEDMARMIIFLRRHGSEPIALPPSPPRLHAIFGTAAPVSRADRAIRVSR